MKMTKKSYLATNSNKILLLLVQFLREFLSSVNVHERSALITWSTKKTWFQLVVEYSFRGGKLSRQYDGLPGRGVHPYMGYIGTCFGNRV